MSCCLFGFDCWFVESYFRLRLGFVVYSGYSSYSSIGIVSFVLEGIIFWNDVMFLDAWRLGYMRFDIILWWEFSGMLLRVILFGRYWIIVFLGDGKVNKVE